MITRRGLFGILAGAVAAPIVVRSGLLMPVKAFKFETEMQYLISGFAAVENIINPPLVAVQGSYDDLIWALNNGGIGFGGAFQADKGLRYVRLVPAFADHATDVSFVVAS